ncbi:MAG TPA: efflux RND transporter periplasmic adaptor subunit [Bryobacteraceae bacterium]|nr:efflux RND transporter periplasmic adaptor subunit [Bryobacteraceae bacterium]
MKCYAWICVMALLTPGFFVSCQSPAKEAPKAVPAASVKNGGVKETDLATIRLTPQAEQRLGIQTAVAEFRQVRRSRTFSGDAMLPPGQSITVSVPVGGTVTAVRTAVGASVRQGDLLFHLQPMAGVQRDLLSNIEADVASARARLDGALQRRARAEQLLKDEVGSVRQKEAAEEEVRVAEVALKAAEARLQQVKRAPLDADVAIHIVAPQSGLVRQVFAAAGQMMPSGAPLAEIARLDALWIRVAVYAGEAAELDTRAAAEIRPLGQETGPPLFLAETVPAPPSADPLANTVDLYYRGGSLRPGQRVNATIPLRGSEEGLAVPRSAIMYDIHGGAWLYENIGPQAFVRQRVDVKRVQQDFAIIGQGLKAGAKVVVAGAAELFGTEFGAGK